MKKAVCMVVRNEDGYIDLALESVLPFVDGVFIVDTGSQDATDTRVALTTGLYKAEDRVTYVQETSYGGDPIRFGRDYREKEVRNWAIEETVKKYDPDWVISLDGDEVLGRGFWRELEKADFAGAETLGHATELPTTPYTLSRNQPDMRQLGNAVLHDPHIRSWNERKIKGRWAQRPKEHVFLNLPVGYVATKPVHYHLHYAFGYKCIYYKLKAGYPEVYDAMVAKAKQHEMYVKDYPESEKYVVNYLYRTELPWMRKEYPDLFDRYGRFIAPAQREDARAPQAPIVNPLPDNVVRRWLNQICLDRIYEHLGMV